MNVPIDVPSPSTVAYVQQGESKHSLKFEDETTSSNNLSHGRLTINLSHEGASFKPAAFVESGLKAELNARKLPIELSDSGQNTIVLEKF